MSPELKELKEETKFLIDSSQGSGSFDQKPLFETQGESSIIPDTIP